MIGGQGTWSAVLGPAGASNPGYWTTGDQTLPGGAKTFTGGPWTFTRTAQASAAETIATFKISDDATSNIIFKNASATDATFVPHLQMQVAGSANNNLQSYEVQTDSGSTAAIVWRAQTIAGAALATRPAFEWRNWTTTIAQITADARMGVGATPTAAVTLDVYAASSPVILTRNGGTYGARLGVDSSNNGYVGSTNATPMEIRTNGVARISVDTAGAAATFAQPIGLKSYTVATLPAATTAGRFIYVSDETGGAVPAFSDGTNWRRVTDRAVVA